MRGVLLRLIQAEQQMRGLPCATQGHDWLPLPEAPRVLLDGPYAAPAQRWEVRDLRTLGPGSGSGSGSGSRLGSGFGKGSGYAAMSLRPNPAHARVGCTVPRARFRHEGGNAVAETFVITAAP